MYRSEVLASQSLSPGEVIALIALILGVVVGVLTVLATVLAPVFLRQRRDRRQLHALEQQSRRIDLHVELTASVVSELANYCRLVAGLTDAALSGESHGGSEVSRIHDKNEWPNLGAVLNRYEDSLQRRVRELELLSADDERRGRALVELGGGLGDGRTDRILEVLMAISEEKASIEEARRAIRSRVDQLLSHPSHSATTKPPVTEA